MWFMENLLMNAGNGLSCKKPVSGLGLAVATRDSCVNLRTDAGAQGRVSVVSCSVGAVPGGAVDTAL